jgi:hypothetical protein
MNIISLTPWDKSNIITHAADAASSVCSLKDKGVSVEMIQFGDFPSTHAEK